MYAAGWDHAMVKACDGYPLSDQIGEGIWHRIIVKECGTEIMI